MKHHDTGYKELFSYPELVQQLIEGFAPSEIASIMDFSTLQLHNGNYVTPLFEEKLEDLVWSVEISWAGKRQQVYLYLLLEFQSTVDTTMPIRLMHYVACFYDHLLKNRVTTVHKGLPPVFPVVLYNGLQRWRARQDIYEMVTPEPPAFLKPYQPHLRYYLIDEGAYSDEELAQRNSALSGLFGIEKSSTDYESLQQAVNRVVAIIRNDPNKERLDRVITRWLKRHLHRLDAEVNLTELNSLVEDNDMLAENLQHWAERERFAGEQQGLRKGIQKGIRQGIQEGKQQGLKEGRLETARNLISQTPLSDEQIAAATGLTVEQIQALRP